MTVSKDILVCSLPFAAGELTVRAWTREDMDRRAAWPAYAEPYAAFNSRWGGMSTAARDAYFAARERDANRMTLTADGGTQWVVAHVVLREIDWEKGMVGNMGVRGHPDWCDRGVGTCLIRAIVNHFAGVGMARFRLDVAGPNARAVRCYEKAGFVRAGEFSRGEVPFLWMEWNAAGRNR